MKTQIIFKSVALLLLLIGVGSFFIKPKAAETVINEPSASEIAFRDLNLEAKAAIVYDPETGEIVYSKNSNTQLPIASLTKVMTALVASERLKTDSQVEITAEAIRQFGDYGFSVGEKMELNDLLNFTLVTSANDGAFALAQAFSPSDATPSEVMNSRAKELNLNQTYFTNATGLDYLDKLPSAQSSAYDLSRLFAYILKNKPEIFEATTHEAVNVTSLSHNAYSGQNTNKLVGKIPGLIGSKTGFTDVASGNLVIAFDRGLAQPIVAIVLGSSVDGRFSDMEQLIHRTMQYYSL